jgi:DNA-binding Lrp family transcriptional regulator
MSSELDEIEIKILKELQRNARLSFKELSLNTGIPKSTIYRKVKKLEEKGIIRRYTINVDESLLEGKITAFILIEIDPDRIDVVGQGLREIREITGVYRITGPYNLIVKVRCSDINDLNSLIKRLHKLGARRTITNIVLEKFLDEGIEFTEDFLMW